jgi:hypothetical protein
MLPDKSGLGRKGIWTDRDQANWAYSSRHVLYAKLYSRGKLGLSQQACFVCKALFKGQTGLIPAGMFCMQSFIQGANWAYHSRHVLYAKLYSTMPFMESMRVLSGGP